MKVKVRRKAPASAAKQDPVLVSSYNRFDDLPDSVRAEARTLVLAGINAIEAMQAEKDGRRADVYTERAPCFYECLAMSRFDIFLADGKPIVRLHT